MRISDWSSDVCSSDLEFEALNLAGGFGEVLDESFAIISRFAGRIFDDSGGARKQIAQILLLHWEILMRSGEDGFRRSRGRQPRSAPKDRKSDVSGKESVSKCRSRWSPYLYNQNPI